MAKKNARNRSPKKRWAFLIYIAGDNNLSDAGLEDIQELCEEGSSESVYVGVEIDTYGEHTGSIRYEITEPDWTGFAHRTVIERLPEKDSGDPDTLLSFLKWGLNRYNADNYIVVVWNHGAGFRSIRRDIGYDDFGTSLDMPEIASAFDRAGVGPEKKIAVLGFDACLMNMIEVAHHFRDHVRILVGSQETEPGDGWPYDRVLREVKRTSNAVDLAKKIVKAYINDYRNIGIFNVTQSAIDLSKTDAPIKALSDLGDLLAQNLDTYREEIRQIRMFTQTFEMADYIDLIHLSNFISQHINHSQIRNAAKKVAEKISACVLASDNLGSVVRNAKGLSVWFPANRNLYFNYRAKYLGLNCNKNGSGWVRFLDSYHY